MRRPHQIAVGVFATWVLLLAPSEAAAQAQDSTDGTPEVLSGEKPQENGFKIGPGRLHLYITEELEYNSAAVILPTSSAPGAPFAIDGEMILHTRPGVNLEIDGDNNSFGLSGDVDYLWYTGWITPGDSYASRLDAAADLHGSFNKNGVIGFNIGDTFSRSANTYTPSIPVGVISLYNQARLEVPIRPGGGALEIVPHVAYGVELFSQYSGVAPGDPACADPTSPCNPANLSQYNYQDLTSGLDVRLKFLPQTAFLFTSSYDARFYSNTTVNPDASELKLQVGLAGLITTKLAVIFKVGWAQGFGTGHLSTVIGQAEVTWHATELASLSVGFLRDVYPVSGNGSYIDDRPYINGKVFLGGRLSLSLTAAYDFFDFAQGDPTTPTASRNDTQLSANLLCEYQVLRWFIVGAGFLVAHHTSTDTLDTLNYTQWQPYVQVTFTY
jgi:hypothetical protein